ncbi:MAG: DUF2442 domain-containing protein [Enterococcus sp.]|nr:DUF2442 domain-containing protein [Enterococcus sp.]
MMNTPNWIVIDVEPRPDYTLVLTFTDGTKKLYDARPLLDKAIYNQLNNIDFFMKAKVECGTVVWNDDIDIAPEHLYECSNLLEGVSNE